MTYTVPPKVNIRNIKAIHADISTYLTNNSNLSLDLSDCEEVDLSLVQLLEAARRSAASSSKSISLTKPANAIVRSTLERAGLTEAFSAEDAKFWLHQEVL